MMISIRCAKIREAHLDFIEGYMWNTDRETRQRFEEQREHDLGECVNGAVCLDLMEEKTCTILDTITLTEMRFNQIRARPGQE